MKYIVKTPDNRHVPLTLLAGTLPDLGEGYEIVGEAKDHPEIVAAMEAESSKAAQLTAAYVSMNTDVYAQMEMVFGTTNSDSAVAYEKTWALMKDTPGEWIFLGLKDDQGEVLDTEAKVVTYATAKLQSVLDYGKYRMQRIQQFKDQRDQILNG